MSANDALLLGPSGLQNRYGHVVAVDGVDLTVHTGDTYRFLGPNGAGNTTAMDIDLGDDTRRDAAAVGANSLTPIEGASRC